MDGIVREVHREGRDGELGAIASPTLATPRCAWNRFECVRELVARSPSNHFTGPW